MQANRKCRTRNVTEREVGNGVSCDMFILEETDTLLIWQKCSNEPNTFLIEGGCYLFNDVKKNYYDAISFCESKDVMGKTGRLVEPKTTTINKLIYDNAKTIFGDSFGYFIGVNDISSEGTWVYSSTGLPATTTIFNSSQPNEGRMANCVDIGSGCGHQENWCDRPCNYDSNEIVCEF